MTNIGKTLRDFSIAGPCIIQGEIIRETDKSLWIADRFTNKTRRVAKSSRFDAGLAHTDACPSCRDHEKTQYPNGYEN